MKINISGVSGFCMGVKKAIDKALEAAHSSSGNVYVDGPIIHNPQVIDLLEEKKVRVLDEHSPIQKDDVIIIRAHGVPPEREDFFRDTGCRTINCTCPLVTHIQQIIHRETQKRKTIIIIGDTGHPEVIGLQGYAQGKAEVISSFESLPKLPADTQLAVVAQSTQDLEEFKGLEKKIRNSFPKATIYNTICKATRERQEAVKALAEQNDAVIIVGGKNSGNTKRLFQIASEIKPTIHIETEDELHVEDLADYTSIGLAGGASTPSWMIMRVKEALSRLGEYQENLFIRILRKLHRFSVNSNLLTALSAFSLAAAYCRAGNIPNCLSYSLIPALFLFSMHTLNRFLKHDSYTYTSPAKALFLGKARVYFFTFGILALVVSGLLAASLSIRHLLILIAFSIPGLIYPLKMVPPLLKKKSSWRSIRDIPGSKDIFVAAGWAFIITLYPPFSNSAFFSKGTLPSFALILLIAGVRTILLDIQDIPGDKITGHDTLPIILGDRLTGSLAGFSLFSALGILISGILFSCFTYAMLIFLFPLVYLGIVHFLYSHRSAYYPYAYETLVETAFILTGILSILM